MVDWRGVHEDAGYKSTPKPITGASVDLRVKIQHHAVSELVQNDAVVSEKDIVCDWLVSTWGQDCALCCL